MPNLQTLSKYKYQIGIILLILVLIPVYILSRNKITRFAKKFIGQEETTGNIDFKNESFKKLMIKAGWYPGAMWCSFFARMIWINKLTGKKKKIAEQLTHGATQQTFVNFQNDTSGLFEIASIPKKGSIVIWQSIKTPQFGHAGIVTNVNSTGFETVEGNSNPNHHPGIVAIHKYSTFTSTPNSDLKLRGFINIV